MSRLITTVLATLVALGSGLMTAEPATPAGGAARVTRERVDNADKEPGQWMTNGRNWGETRFSPLKQINDSNVSRLGLAWFAELNTYRGVEATPLVIDGVLYNVSAWSITTAYDAVTGKVLWTFDPKVPLEYARIACCGPVSRGLAAWHGKIYVAALDGRLIALDAKTGKSLWQTQTLDPGQPLSLTGAPRIAGGNVVIGNAGGDFGARGYMQAVDAETGKKTWRFWIVPGDPKKMPEGDASDSAMPMAAKTWSGEWWKTGGGGSDWDALVYDPKLDLLYFGTGNGSPHPQAFRSPGGGDNLFLCSIVAVNAHTGKYVWHYQEVPQEEWDYDCTAPLMLTNLKIQGKERQVILHAPKNGFFYVLDRKTGELISAETYVPNTWAEHINLSTGRPEVKPEAYVTEKPTLITPSYGGSHSWHPMSYSPITGLVYFPVMEQWAVESRLPDGQFKFTLGTSTIGAGVKGFTDLRKELNDKAGKGDKGYLLAYDPVKQKEAFRIDYPFPANGGAFTTAGNLLIEGTIRKTLAIYRADNGTKLWEMNTESVPVASAMSFMVKGKQYIGVNVGWNSAIVHNLGFDGKPFYTSSARLMVFALDSKGVTLPPTPAPGSIPDPPDTVPKQADVDAGAVVYAQQCAICHGQNANGGVKDLRHMTPERHAEFLDIVLNGKLKAGGMESFKDKVTQEQAEQIHAYVIARAQEDWQPDFMRPRRPANAPAAPAVATPVR